MRTEHCVNCDAKLQPATLTLRGLKLEGLKCPKCGEKVFNEKQMDVALAALEQKRLKKEYKKTPIKIGNSYGVIFPRDLVRVFNLDSGKPTLDFKMDISKNKIEITVL